MKTKITILSLLSLLLIGCSQNSSFTSLDDKKTSQNSTSLHTTSEIKSSEETNDSTSENVSSESSENVSSESSDNVSSESSDNVSSESSEIESSSNIESSENTSLDHPSSEEQSEPESSEELPAIPSTNEPLPIGGKSLDGPENRANPYDISTYEAATFNLKSYLPDNWSFITGYKKHDTCSNFYSNAAGGFKFTQKYYGFQTCVFNSWTKLEVRLNVAHIVRNQQKIDKDAPIFHIYPYDINGHLINKDIKYIEQGAITEQRKEIKFYWTNEDIAYFEVRLNAFPYVNSKCYNFSIGEVMIKGWPEI